MTTRFTTPIPQDRIGETFVWRDWFQRVSDKLLGTLGQQDSNNVSITGGTIDGTSIGKTVSSSGSFTNLKLGQPLATIYGGTGTNAPVSSDAGTILGSQIFGA